MRLAHSPILALAALAALPAFAADYDTLLSAYQQATQPATLADFQPATMDAVLEQPISDKKCLVVKASDPTTLEYTEVAVITRVVSPAQTDLGPLIPDVPAVTEPLLIPGTPSAISEAKYAGNYSLFHLSTTATDLVVTVDKNDNGIYSDVGANGVVFEFRKTDAYLPFVLQASDAASPWAAGYCYPEPAPAPGN